MIYLVEIDGVGADGVLTTARFGTTGYTTKRTDTPPNVGFEPRVINAGNFERAMFGLGRTFGEAEVGYGSIEIAIGDDGGGHTADYLSDLAVDGRALRIYGLDSSRSSWSSRQLIFAGTMEQVEVQWTRATIRIRDRLAELREPVQDVMYAGTTVAGDMDEAEGTADDLKDRPKPMLRGRARNIPAVLANQFDRIYQISSNPLSGIQGVFDSGVALTAGPDHPTLAALRTATIAGGTFHTCLALGLFRLAGGADGAPKGDITADATEGGDGQRSAGGIVRRMLEHFGLSTAEYSGPELEALADAVPAELGVWLPPEPRDLLSSATAILDSIGGYLVPDRLGVLRSGRLVSPSAGGPVLDKNVILDTGEGIERIATDDTGRGVPAHKVTVEYARSMLVQTGSMLDNTAITDERKAFVGQEFRKATAEAPAVKERHLLATELNFPTLLANEADATAEAQRRLALYSVRRDRYRVPVAAEIAADLALDLDDSVTLRLRRFGLDAGRPMRVSGIEVDLGLGIVTYDLWG